MGALPTKYDRTIQRCVLNGNHNLNKRGKVVITIRYSGECGFSTFYKEVRSFLYMQPFGPLIKVKGEQDCCPSDRLEIEIIHPWKKRRIKLTPGEDDSSSGHSHHNQHGHNHPAKNSHKHNDGPMSAGESSLAALAKRNRKKQKEKDKKKKKEQQQQRQLQQQSSHDQSDDKSHDLGDSDNYQQDITNVETKEVPLTILLHSKISNRRQYINDWLVQEQYERDKLVKQIDEILMEEPPQRSMSSRFRQQQLKYYDEKGNQQEYLDPLKMKPSPPSPRIPTSQKDKTEILRSLPKSQSSSASSILKTASGDSIGGGNGRKKESVSFKAFPAKQPSSNSLKRENTESPSPSHSSPLLSPKPSMLHIVGNMLVGPPPVSKSLSQLQQYSPPKSLAETIAANARDKSSTATNVDSTKTYRRRSSLDMPAAANNDLNDPNSPTTGRRRSRRSSIISTNDASILDTKDRMEMIRNHEKRKKAKKERKMEKERKRQERDGNKRQPSNAKSNLIAATSSPETAGGGSKANLGATNVTANNPLRKNRIIKWNFSKKRRGGPTTSATTPDVVKPVKAKVFAKGMVHSTC